MKRTMSYLTFTFFALYFIRINAVFTEKNIHKTDDELLRREKTYLSYQETFTSGADKRAYFIRNGLLSIEKNKDYIISSKPLLSSSKFDCKIKELAFDFAKKLSAGTTMSTAVEQKYIFDALELGALCNKSFSAVKIKPYNLYKQEENDSPNTVNVFVDKANINDLHDGSFERPFKTIQSGINACISRRKKRSGKCHIFIRGGIYILNETLLITNGNIEVSNFRDESVVVTSDKVVSPKWNLFKLSLITYQNLNPLFEGIKPKENTTSIKYFGTMDNYFPCEKQCSAMSSCSAFAFFNKSTAEFSNQCYIRFDGIWSTVSHAGVTSGKKIKIYSADLSEVNLKKIDQIFINNRRAIRARFPNANPETMGLHTLPTGYVNDAKRWLAPNITADATEIHVKSPVRPKSLFDNFGIGVGGSVHQFKPPQSYWATKYPVGGGGATYKVPSGLEYSEDLEINLRSWSNPSTGIVHCFQHYHWGNWMYQLDTRNMTSKTLHWTWGGFQEARGSADGREWYVENIFEELDSANEWFYDKDKKTLYFFPNETDNNDRDILPEKLSIPQLTSLLNIIGTQRNPVQNVSVKGITFKHTTQTFLESYMVPSGGDWSVHRNAMLYMEGTEGVIIDECTFDSPGGNGIFVSDYNRHTVISHNLFFRLGDNGIVLVGDSHLIDGSQGGQPRGVQVLYNLVFENGIWGKQTYAFVQSKSCESNVEGNIFFNGPRAGININDGFGGGNVIDNNLLFNFVRETDDHGPINTWDRVPYLTKLGDGNKFSLHVKENHINRNFLINNYRSVWPIDHDDGTCFWNDTYNYLVYGGFKNYLGHDKTSMHNVYVYPDRHPAKGASMSSPVCADTAGQSLGTSGYNDRYENNTCIIGRTNIYQLGFCFADHLRELIPHFANNRYYTTNATIIAQCGFDTWNLEQMISHGMEVGTVVSHLVDDDVVIGWGKELLGL